MHDAGPGGAVSAGLWRSLAGFWRISLHLWRSLAGLWRSLAGFWRTSLHLGRSLAGLWRTSLHPGRASGRAFGASGRLTRMAYPDYRLTRSPRCGSAVFLLWILSRNRPWSQRILGTGL